MSENLNRARSLRRQQTEAERALWSKLRSRRFGKFKFRRQVPLGPYIVDFVCLDRRLVIELDGGQHAQQREYDAARTAWLEANGFRVVRVWNHQLWEERDAVDELIWRELNRELAGGVAPSPGSTTRRPLPRGERKASPDQPLPD